MCQSPQVSARLRRCRAALLLAIWLFGCIPQQGYAAAPVPSDKPAAYPAWWFERKVIPRLDPTDPAPLWSRDVKQSYPLGDDYAVVNQGQLKHLATKAAEELEDKLPGGAGAAVDAAVEAFTTQNLTQEISVSAAQSSTMWDGDASRAIDGDASGEFASESVSHTGNNTYAWLQVDLGAERTVRQVVVWNRTDDCCASRTKDFYVFVANKDISGPGFTPSVLIADPEVWKSPKITTQPAPAINIPVGAFNGRFVKVQVDATEMLHLAEVEVKGDLQPGRAIPDDYKSANHGQLKNLTRPFYDRLMDFGLAAGYPWTGSAGTRDDFLLANFGQAKQLFAFAPTENTSDFVGDADQDGFPDWWETLVYANSGNIVVSGEPFSDAAAAPPLASSGTSPLTDPDPENRILPASTIFSPPLYPRDTLPPPHVLVEVPENFDASLSGWQRHAEVARIKIFEPSEHDQRSFTYRLFRRTQTPRKAQPSNWTFVEEFSTVAVTPNTEWGHFGKVRATYEDSVDYNVLYWYRVVRVDQGIHSQPTQVSHAAPLEIRYEYSAMAATGWRDDYQDLSADYRDHTLRFWDDYIEDSSETFDESSTREEFIDRFLSRLKAGTERIEEGTFYPWSGSAVPHGESLSAHWYYSESESTGTWTDVTEVEQRVTAKTGKGTVSVNRAHSASPIGVTLRMWFYPTESTLEEDIEPYAIWNSDLPNAGPLPFDLNMKGHPLDIQKFGTTSSGDSTVHHYGNGDYALVVDPVLQVEFRGGNSMLPTAFADSLHSMIRPGEELRFRIYGASLPARVYTHGEIEYELTWDKTAFDVRWGGRGAVGR